MQGLRVIVNILMLAWSGGLIGAGIGVAIGGFFGPLLGSLDLDLLLDTMGEVYGIPGLLVAILKWFILTMPGGGLALVICSMFGGWIAGVILGLWVGLVSGAIIGALLGVGDWAQRKLPVTGALAYSRLDFFFDHGLSAWIGRLMLRDVVGWAIGATYAEVLLMWYSAHLTEIGPEANIPLMFGVADVVLIGGTAGFLTGGLCVRIHTLAPWALNGAAVAALATRAVYGEPSQEELYTFMAVGGLIAHVLSLVVGPLRGRWSLQREGALVALTLSLLLSQSPPVAIGFALVFVFVARRFGSVDPLPERATEYAVANQAATGATAYSVAATGLGGAASSAAETGFLVGAPGGALTTAPIWTWYSVAHAGLPYILQFKTIGFGFLGLFVGGFFGYFGGGFLVWLLVFSLLPHLGALRGKWSLAGQQAAAARAAGAPVGAWFGLGMGVSASTFGVICALVLVGLMVAQKTLVATQREAAASGAAAAGAPQAAPAPPAPAMPAAPTAPAAPQAAVKPAPTPAPAPEPPPVANDAAQEAVDDAHPQTADEQQAQAIMRRYFDDLNANTFDAPHYFASRVERYVGMRNTTPAAINRYIHNVFPTQFKRHHFELESGSMRLEAPPRTFVFVERSRYFRVKTQSDDDHRYRVRVTFTEDWKLTHFRQFEQVEEPSDAP